jgi:hypothetical protein
VKEEDNDGNNKTEPRREPVVVDCFWSIKPITRMEAFDLMYSSTDSHCEACKRCSP